MKVRLQLGSRGIALIEVIAYIGVFFVVVGLAYYLFFRTEEQSRSLRRSADDITAAMNAGERWRADIRAAVAAPVVDANGLMRIPQRGGEVRYSLRDGALWREAGGRAAKILPQVQRSIFEKDSRERVTAWRCTVELRKRRHQATITPLFTFTAVPQPGGQR
jgi:hypothetical protein